jgi:hypothetical protein
VLFRINGSAFSTAVRTASGFAGSWSSAGSADEHATMIRIVAVMGHHHLPPLRVFARVSGAPSRLKGSNAVGTR